MVSAGLPGGLGLLASSYVGVDGIGSQAIDGWMTGNSVSYHNLHS